MTICAERHNQEIESNRLSWERKPVLRTVYRDFYSQIRSKLIERPAAALNVEIGSGIGNIKEHLPDCITTDLFPNPGIDRVENAYRLSFREDSVANLILFDVWHHLEYPANFLAEATRVLIPGGRLIVMDPAMSWTGQLIYGLFHHEPLGRDIRFLEEPVELRELETLPYFAAQSSAHRLLWRREAPGLLEGWQIVEIDRITSFAYLASGGFRGPQLYPFAALPFVKMVDRALGIFPAVFAARLLVVLSKESAA